MRIIDADNVIRNIEFALNTYNITGSIKAALEADKELIETQPSLPIFYSNDICRYCRYEEEVNTEVGMVEDKVGMIVHYCSGCGSKNSFERFRGKVVAEVAE